MRAIWLVLSVACCICTEADEFALQETEASIEIRSKGKLVLRYNKLSPMAPSGIDPVYHRSGFLHPVCSPSGNAVTASFPFDHPHQQGIFSAWVKTKYHGRDVDFWNLKKRSGRVVHHRVVEVYTGRQKTGFAIELLHRSEGENPIDILSETWKVTAVPTDGSFHCFDLQTKQRALTSHPLQIEQFHYGGVAVRGPATWLIRKDSESSSRSDGASAHAGFKNSLGSDRLTGNHQKPNWVTMWGSTQGSRASVTVLCNPRSFRAPQSTRLHPNKPYFCFCPAVDGDFVIDQETPYEASYRFLINDSTPQPEWVEAQWRLYTKG